MVLAHLWGDFTVQNGMAAAIARLMEGGMGKYPQNNEHERVYAREKPAEEILVVHFFVRLRNGREHSAAVPRLRIRP